MGNGNGMHQDPLEALLRAARRDEPEPLADARSEAMVASAIRTARTRRNMRTVVTSSLVVTLAAAAAIVALRREPEPRPEIAHTPTVAPSLPSTTRAGDKLHATAQAAFTVDSDEPTARRIVLTHGAVLCDVRPLGAGSSFEVVADDVHVRVRGTVFSVEHETMTVRVYEGVVEVESDDVQVLVYAGQRWQRERGLGTLDPHVLDPIANEATEARTHAEVVPAPEPMQAVVDAPVVAEATPPEAAGTPDEASADDSATDAPPRALPTRLVTPSPTEAEALLRHGDANAALALAEAERARGGASPRWALVRADALRALGRAADAADAYDDAARIDARHRAEAGYAAASLRYRALHDSAGALRSLDAAGAVSSSLAERALTLRVKLLRAEGRDIEARNDAEQYLTRFPEGTSATFMQGVLGREP